MSIKSTMNKISIILPCKDEELAIKKCVNKIENVFNKNKNYEIIIVDNNSVDNSAKVIRKLQQKNKRIKYLFEKKIGYGNAYLRGVKCASGKFVIMGDCDGSYDFNEIPKFLKELKKNYLVVGSRYLGEIKKGAMPWSHRYIGNLIIRFLLKIHKVDLREVCTGFIGIRKSALDSLELKSQGMELSSEILVKAKKNNLKTKEIPIKYSPRIGKSKLKEIRDGLRHLIFLTREAI